MYQLYMFIAFFLFLNFSCVPSLLLNVTEDESTINTIKFNKFTKLNQNVSNKINDSVLFKEISANLNTSENLNHTGNLNDKNASKSLSTCDCGINSIGCRYDNPLKYCTCKPGYAQKDYTIYAYCERCNCGPYSKECKFYYSKKNCTCQDGYADFRGFCTQKLCDCGPNSEFCQLEDEMKEKCFCKEGYSQVSGTCKKCDCGIGAESCKFHFLGNKECTCKKGYSGTASLQDEKCEKCDCGYYAESCFFNYLGIKKCVCKKNGVISYDYFKGETCQKCDCGTNAVSCKMVNSFRKCYCAPGYVARATSWNEECIKEIKPITSWRIATYILIIVFGVLIFIQLKIFCQKSK